MMRWTTTLKTLIININKPYDKKESKSERGNSIHSMNNDRSNINRNEIQSLK